jgi:two-component system, NarL family, sensor histidine kinase DesK
VPDDRACENPFEREPIFAPGLRPTTPAGRLRKTVGISLSLGWLAIPVVDLAGSHPAWWRVALVAVAMAVWFVVYLGYVLARPPIGRQRDTLIWLLVLAAIAVVLTVADRPTWAILVIYCSAAGGISLDDDRWAARWIFGCTGLAAVLLFSSDIDDGSAISLTATTLAIGFLMFSFGRMLRANAALREAQEQLAATAVDAERLRFARDLHDLLGHTLSVIALKAQLARRLMDSDPETARREIADVEAVTRTALGEVRDAVSGYRQPRLATELAGAQSALDAAGIACTVEHAEVALPPSGEAVLAWGVREATTNVIRHSGASHCAIRIDVALDEARLEVTDDGAASNGTADGTGLRGLAERASDAGGRLDAGPRNGGGFGLELRIPLGRLA